MIDGSYNKNKKSFNFIFCSKNTFKRMQEDLDMYFIFYHNTYLLKDINKVMIILLTAILSKAIQSMTKLII